LSETFRIFEGVFVIKTIRHQRFPTFKTQLRVVLLGAALATLATACAATPTRESTGGYVDDSTITAKIKSDLVQDNKLSAADVHVKTYKGVVDLSGFVNKQSQVPEAEILAGKVSGVKSVHNNLIVKGTVAPATATENRVE
jgi:hyperosmotically inducible periplasmic protein